VLRGVVRDLILWLWMSVLWSGRGKKTEFHVEPEATLELMMAANDLHT
jgi:hypothetical protein